MLADAPGAPDAWQWEAGPAWRTLVERDSAGARLLKESGPLARLRITARPSWAPAGRIEFSANAAYAALDYEGHTQGGAPLATRSHHTEGEGGVRWLPAQPYAWGTPSMSLDVLWFRRSIGATPGVSGLIETSTLWMPGVGWQSPAWRVAGRPFTASVSWRASADHRLHVDFAGLFDAASLQGGRRDEWRAALRTTTGGGWSISLEASRARQAESAVAPLSRGGAPAGTVRQPRLAVTDVGLMVGRSF